MRRFMIIANSIKDPDGKYTEEISNRITAQGGEVTERIEDAEAILVLGGDGTLLKVAGDNLKNNIPLLGINLGTLGYLAEADMNDIDNAINMLLTDSYSIEERMMLYGFVPSEDNKGVEYSDHALNDIAVTGCGPLAIVKYDLYVNGELLNRYDADGIIIATPTGSTGYNMSAGGPIVDPKAALIVVTPICAHTLNTRSIVLSADAQIEIRINAEQRTPVAAVFDGRQPHTLTPSMSVHIKRSDEVTRIIKLRRESFLNTLHAKLK